MAGDYLDIRCRQAALPDVYATASHVASQVLGRQVRAGCGARILHDSLRLAGGIAVAAYRSRNLLDVSRADHYEITVQAAKQAVLARKRAA